MGWKPCNIFKLLQRDVKGFQTNFLQVNRTGDEMVE